MAKKKKKRRRRSGKSVSPQLKERTYQAGLSYFREGEYEQAIHAWSGILKNSGPKLAMQLAEAHFRSALAKYESDDIKAVISELHSALKYSDHSHPVYLFHTGLAYHRMGKLPQAISYYTQAVHYAPEVERYIYHLGLAHLQNGEYQKSIGIFESIHSSCGRIGEALACISQGDHKRALAVLDAAHELNSNEISLLRGLIYLTQEDHKEAKRLLKMAAGNGTENGASDYYLGIAHIRTDTILSAINAWEEASRKGLDIGFMKDDMANIYRQLAAKYFDREDLDKAVKIWEKLSKVEPGDEGSRSNLVHAYFLRGNDYAKAEKITYAIRYWEKAWELDSENVDIAHNLALAHEKRNELETAAEYWKEAATGWKRQRSASSNREILKARMYTVHTHLADIALNMDNMGRAIAEYRQALRYSPEEVETIVRLANLHMMQGGGDSAIQLLTRARRLSPTDTDILQQLSLAYAMKGKINQSIDCIKEVLKIDPGNQLYREMVGQYYLGRAEDALGMKKHRIALNYLNEGLEICPDNIELRAVVGAVYLNMGDKSEAEDAFQTAIAINSMDAKPYITVAHHYLDNEIVDDAEAYFAKAVELDPDDPHVYVDIASEYCSFDMCKQALEYFEKAKKVKPGDAFVMIHIVEVMMKHDCEYGIQYAKELMSVAPNDPKSHFFLGLAYHLNDMDDEAMDTLIEGTDVAEKTDDDEMLDEIESLFSHIEFERSFGGFRQMVDMLDDMEELW